MKNSTQTQLPEVLQDELEMASIAELKMYAAACLAEIKRRKKALKNETTN